MRESPSPDIIKKLPDAGARVNAYDRVAMNGAKHYLEDRIPFARDQHGAFISTGCPGLETEW